MKIKNIIEKTGTALLFAVAIFFSFELYSIYLQSLSVIPILILFLGVFGILSYYKYNKKLKIEYFILAYLVLIGFLAFISIFLIKSMFIISLIIFDLTIIPFIFLIDKYVEKFRKKQRLLVKIKIYVVETLSALIILGIFIISFGLISITITPQTTTFLPNITAKVYYSSSILYNYKPLNDPNDFLFFYYFNPTNKTEIEGIANVIRVDNISYNNSFRAYCLNAQTTKYWVQDCISYQPYFNVFSNGQNYMLQTEIWQGDKSLLNVAEIIPNASIYKNQTFYLKLVVKNNTEIVYETNNGKTEYIKVVLPKNQSFGVITDNSSMNTEIHENSYFAINTGPLNFYALNSTLTSLSGNFTYEFLALMMFPFKYSTGNFSFKASCFGYCSINNYEGANDLIYNVNALSNNSVMTTTFYLTMNAMQLKDLQSIENGSCKTFFIPNTNWVLLENYTKLPGNTPLNNIHLCNSNESLEEFWNKLEQN